MPDLNDYPTIAAARAARCITGAPGPALAESQELADLMQRISATNTEIKAQYDDAVRLGCPGAALRLLHAGQDTASAIGSVGRRMGAS